MGVNAQTSVPTFTAGEVLTAANMNISAATGIPVFATTTTRDAAFGGTGEKTLAEGQLCYVEASPKRYQVYDGTSWQDFDVAGTSYTPTLTNITLGNGSVSGSYYRLGKYVFGGVSFNFGTTTSISGLMGFSLPFTADTSSNNYSSTQVLISDVGTTVYIGLGYIGGSGARMDIYAQAANATYLLYAGTSSTIPMTWANTDGLFLSFYYKAA